MASPDATLVTISNTNDPIMSPDGIPLSGLSVYFRLVNESLRPDMMLDAVSREIVVSSPVTAVANANGEITVDLWPNDRGLAKSCYRVTTENGNVKPFFITVLSSSTSLYGTAAAYAEYGPVSNGGATSVGGDDFVLDESILS